MKEKRVLERIAKVFKFFSDCGKNSFSDCGNS